MRVCCRLASCSKLPCRTKIHQYSQTAISRIGEPVQKRSIIPPTKARSRESAVISDDVGKTHGVQSIDRIHQVCGSSLKSNVAQDKDVTESSEDGDRRSSQDSARTSRIAPLPLSPLMDPERLASRSKHHLPKMKERRGSTRTPFQQALANNIYGMILQP